MTCPENTFNIFKVFQSAFSFMELLYRTLPCGVKVPLLGVCPSTSGNVTGLIQSALNVGYRHLVSDTSGDQDNAIGNLLQWCAENDGLPREELFITIKVEVPDQDENYDEIGFVTSLRKRLRYLGQDKADMLVLSKPPYAESLVATTEGRAILVSCWTTFRRLLNEGKVSCLAVENLDDDEVATVSKVSPCPSIAMSCNFRTVADLKPRMALRGIETAVTLPFDIRRWAHNKLGDMLGKSLEEIAKSVDKSLEQIVVRYMLQKHLIVVCAVQSVAKTFEIWDFALSLSDVEKMSVLLKGQAFGQ